MAARFSTRSKSSFADKPRAVLNGRSCETGRALARRASEGPMSDIGSDIPPAALTIRSLSAPQAHIERALPAVSDVGVLEPDDQRAEFRQREPERNLPPEHTAFGAI